MAAWDEIEQLAAEPVAVQSSAWDEIEALTASASAPMLPAAQAIPVAAMGATRQPTPYASPQVDESQLSPEILRIMEDKSGPTVTVQNPATDPNRIGMAEAANLALRKAGNQIASVGDVLQRGLGVDVGADLFGAPSGAATDEILRTAAEITQQEDGRSRTFGGEVADRAIGMIPAVLAAEAGGPLASAVGAAAGALPVAGRVLGPMAAKAVTGELLAAPGMAEAYLQGATPEQLLRMGGESAIAMQFLPRGAVPIVPKAAQDIVKIPLGMAAGNIAAETALGEQGTAGERFRETALKELQGLPASVVSMVPWAIPGMAARIRARSPELAAKIAAQATPSRTPFEQAGENGTSKEVRVVVAEELRKLQDVPRDLIPDPTKMVEPAVKQDLTAAASETPAAAEPPVLTPAAPQGAARQSKQPWEMTRNEFENSFVFRGVGDDNSQAPNTFWGNLSTAKQFAGSNWDREASRRRGGLVRSRKTIRLLRNENVPQDLLYDEYGNLYTPQEKIRKDGEIGPYADILVKEGKVKHPDADFEVPQDGTNDPHRWFVENAIRAGKPVPPEVLSDYQDLQPSPATAEIPRQDQPGQAISPGPVSKVGSEADRGVAGPGAGLNATERATQETPSKGDRVSFVVQPKTLGVKPKEMTGRVQAVSETGELFVIPDKGEPMILPSSSVKTVKPKGITAALTEAEQGQLGSLKKQLAAELGGGELSSGLNPNSVVTLAKIGGLYAKAGYRTAKQFIQQLIADMPGLAGRLDANDYRTIYKRVMAGSKDKTGFEDIDLVDDATLMGHAQQPQRQGPVNAPRPDLANQGMDPAARNLIDAVDQQRNDAGQPETRAREVAKTNAAQRLEADYAGERERLRSGKLGLTEDDTATAVGVVRQEASEAMRSGDPDRIAEAMKTADAYRKMRTEQARALGHAVDPQETPEQRSQRILNEAIMEPDRNTDARIREAEGAGKQDQADTIRRKAAERVAATKQELKKAGLDIDDPVVHGDPVRVARALGQIAASKGSRWDAAYEYWRNSLLSAPVTAIRNMSAVPNVAWRNTAVRLVEAMGNTFAGRSEAQQWGGFTHALAGLLPGMRQGARNFIRTWQSEVSAFDQQYGGAGTQKWVDESTGRNGTPNVHIAGKKGRVIRAPQRFLAAMDDFNQTMSAWIEVGDYAFRIAKKEGLKGEQLQRRIQDLVTDTNSKAWLQAVEKARDLNFHEPMGTVGEKILGLKRDVPGVRWFMPFVTTAVNVTKTGMRMTPLGSYTLAKDLYRGARTGDYSKAAYRAAEQLIGWSVVLALFQDDPDDPWITGTQNRSSAGSRQMAQRTTPAQSIYIPGIGYVSYKDAEPFATALASTVDVVRAIQSGSTKKMLRAPWESIVSQVRDKTFMQGIGDLMAIFDPRDPSNVSEWSSKFATSFIPNIVKSSLRSASDTYPERRVWGKGSEWATRLLRRTAQNTELPFDAIQQATGKDLGLADQPAIDIWGRTSSRRLIDGGGTADWAARMTIPTRRPGNDTFVGDRVLARWNAKHPDDEVYPQPTQKYYEDRDGKTVYLTDAQYRQFSELAGGMAKRRVEAMLARKPDDRLNNPTKADVEHIQDILSKSRTEARRHLQPKWKKWSDQQVDEYVKTKVSARSVGLAGR